MSEFPKTSLNKVQRLPARGNYDSETIYKIVDEALICHVGFVSDGQPIVMPMIHTRIGNTIYFHGALANRMLKHIQSGNSLCITVTHVDGIVFARSIFHHSMNYRSAMLFGKGRVVETDEEKNKVFLALTDHIAKGRWDDAKIPTPKEVASTLVVAVEIESASAKIRTGPPNDDEEDLSLPVWAGVLPMRTEYLPPEKEKRVSETIEIPNYIKHYKR
jgi:uncharacterized protein